MKDPRVDAYIAAAPEFAQPILVRIRNAFHAGCPTLTETIKWSVPHFEHHGMLGGMAAFKKHVSIGFWKGGQLSDPHGLLAGVGDGTISSIRIESLKALPKKEILVEYVRAAAALNESNATATAKGQKSLKATQKPKPKPELPIPPLFAKALRSNAKAKATFDAFSPSKRRDYVEWITEAKRDATRDSRIATAIEWLAEGKSKHWKYERC